MGGWVQKQRCNESGISLERKTRLESLAGWSWDAISEQWEKSFLYLQEFVAREGHCRVPAKYRASDGYRLGEWVSNQRGSKEIIESVFPDRKNRLEQVIGWTWAARDDRWEEGFGYLKEFVDCEGHARVIHSYRTESNYRLGSWVIQQRTKKESMSPERRARLEALPGWTWDVIAQQWEEGFRHLKEHVEREGNAQVAQSYKTADEFRLGVWVATQRKNVDKMTLECKTRLEALPGWVWRVK